MVVWSAHIEGHQRVQVTLTMELKVLGYATNVLAVWAWTGRICGPSLVEHFFCLTLTKSPDRNHTLKKKVCVVSMVYLFWVIDEKQEHD